MVTTLSQRNIQQHLPLCKISGLYIQAAEEKRHEKIPHVQQNYLDTLYGFDIDKVATPSEWAPDANRQQG